MRVQPQAQGQARAEREPHVALPGVVAVAPEEEAMVGNGDRNRTSPGTVVTTGRPLSREQSKRPGVAAAAAQGQVRDKKDKL